MTAQIHIALARLSLDGSWDWAVHDKRGWRDKGNSPNRKDALDAAFAAAWIRAEQVTAAIESAAGDPS